MAEASRLMLEPKRNPHPKGIDWWNEECNATHTTGQLATTFTERYKATINLHQALQQAK